MAREIIFSIFFILIFSFVSAQVEVRVAPLNSDGNYFYPLEVNAYKISVANPSQTSAQSVEITIKDPTGKISFPIEGNGGSTRRFTLINILPGRSQERNFDVRALENSSGAVEIIADYSVGDDLGSTSSFATISKSAVEVDAGIGKPSLAPNESSKIDFKITNNSQETLSGISAELFSASNVVVESVPFEKASLAPAESVSGTMDFTLGKDTGKSTLLLRVFFDDANGTHVLEKEFPLEVQSGDYIALLLVAGVVLIVLIYFFTNKGGKN